MLAFFMCTGHMIGITIHVHTSPLLCHCFVVTTNPKTRRFFLLHFNPKKKLFLILVFGRKLFSYFTSVAFPCSMFTIFNCNICRGLLNGSQIVSYILCELLSIDRHCGV